jgi:predicted dehydrogenase
MHMRDDQSFPTGGHYGSTWRADPERAGSGVLLEHSIHDVDLFSVLFGPVKSVVADTRETSGHSGIEDVAHVRFRHDKDLVSSLATVWHSVATRQSGRSLEIFFEKVRFTTDQDYFGSISMEVEDQPAVTLTSDEVLARFMELQQLNPDEEDLRSIGGLGDRRFLEAVTTGSPSEPSFEHALTAHAIVDACYRSAVSGEEENVSAGT